MSPTECWVGGSTTTAPVRGFVSRWRNGGWEAPVCPVTTSITGIYAANPGDVWFAADASNGFDRDGTILRFRTGTDPTPPSGETCGQAAALRSGLDSAQHWRLGARQDVRVPTACGADASGTTAVDGMLRATVPSLAGLELAFFPTSDNELTPSGLFAFEGSASVCAGPTSCVAASDGATRNGVAFFRYWNGGSEAKTLQIVANASTASGPAPTGAACRRSTRPAERVARSS